MDYQLTKKYFHPQAKKGNGGAIILIILGAVVLAPAGFLNLLFGILAATAANKDDSTGIAVTIFFIIFGLLLLAGGIVFIIAGIKAIGRIKKKNAEIEASWISDFTYDDMVSRYLENLKQDRALELLGLDSEEVNEIAPISFGGYRFSGAANFKRGKDGSYRTDAYEAVILFFSANDIHCYTANFKTSENRLSESTDVYFYRDVVSVSTAEESEQYLNQSIPMQKFVLRTTGGTSLTVSLNKTADTDRSINAMRNLLREKKQSMA